MGGGYEAHRNTIGGPHARSHCAVNEWRSTCDNLLLLSDSETPLSPGALNLNDLPSNSSPLCIDPISTRNGNDGSNASRFQGYLHAVQKRKTEDEIASNGSLVPIRDAVVGGFDGKGRAVTPPSYKPNVILLCMVYSQESSLRHQRDLLRILATESESSCRVFTIDNLDPISANADRHIGVNLNAVSHRTIEKVQRLAGGELFQEVTLGFCWCQGAYY
jgi:hypothetical protein